MKNMFDTVAFNKELCETIKSLGRLINNPVENCEDDFISSKDMYSFRLEDCQNMVLYCTVVGRYLKDGEYKSTINDIRIAISKLYIYLSNNEEVWFVEDQQKEDLYDALYSILMDKFLTM